MADIFEKDLDAWDTSVAATNPFFLKPSEVSADKYISGEDLDRSIRITEQLKNPIELRALSYNPESTGAQAGESLYTGIADTLSKIAPSAKNWASQLGIQMFSGENVSKKYQDKMKEFGINWLNDEELKGRQEIIDMLNGSVYPVNKYFRRLLAKSTQDISERNILRELYQQSHGVDSSKWYNQLPYILGSTVAIPVPARGASTIVRLAGGTRYGAAKAAENVARGLVFAEEAGEFSAETAQEYLDRTGDRNFENFTPSDTAGLLASLNGYINQKIEFMGDMDLMLLGAIRKVGVRTPLGKAAARGALTEYLEEGAQGTSRAILKTIEGDEEPLIDKIKQAWVNATWALPIGGALAPVGYYVNRRNLVKGIKQAVPNITNTQAVQVADVMIDTAGETILPNQTLYNDLRKKIEYMYRDSDIDNKNDIIDATTELEYTLIVGDSLERGIDIADNPLFKGEVNELGWFREGIPEERRTEIQGYIDELNDLKAQLKTLNEAKEKDWTKIDEIENKLDKFNRYVLDKLSDLARADARQVAKILSETEQKFVNREKKKKVKKALQKQKKTTHDYGDVAPESVVEEEKNGLKYWFISNNQGGGRIRLLTPENEIIGQINIKPEGVGYIYIEPKYRGDKYGDLLWQEAQRFSNPREISASDREDTPLERAIRFWKKRGFTHVGGSKLVREIDETKQLEKFPENPKEPTVEEDGNVVLYQDEVFDIADENARLDDIYPAYDGETIDIDGKQRTVYNSNGDRIAKSAEALRNFYKWFGDSKVVDEQGRPLVVYHNSGERRTILSREYARTASDVHGVFFAPKPDPYKGYGPYEHAVYLKIENPADFETTYRKHGIELGMTYDAGIKVREWLQNNGYDGSMLYEDRKLYELIAFEPNQIKSVDNRGTFSEDTGNIYRQNRVSGGAPSTYRGAYIPQYRFIQRANNMDASTLSHELAHDWFEVNFARYRSGKASKDFMRAWGALEKALGVEENAKVAPRKASEAFARAYEGWVMNKTDWEKLIAVEDKDKEKVVKLMQDYQNNLRDIYQDLTSSYFKETWGKLGELKPELVQWFDRMVNITDLDVLAERGEISQEQANQEKLNRAIDTVIENTADTESKKQLEYARTLNDTQRYEVEGGNKNALQRRLSALAQAIDENNMLMKENYDTRRDMLEVARQADNFVRTRLDDALAIINGQMAEQEGLFKEDIYTALERLALENGDLGLLDELKNSEIANRLAKELGQRVAGFRNWNGGEVDVASTIKALDNRFNKALQNKKAQTQLNDAEKMFAKTQEQQDKLADKELESILNELRCK